MLKDAKGEGEDKGEHQEEEGLGGGAWDVDGLLHNLEAAQFLQILQRMFHYLKINALSQ